jgi:hypothetical protein
MYGGLFKMMYVHFMRENLPLDLSDVFFATEYYEILSH